MDTGQSLTNLFDRLITYEWRYRSPNDQVRIPDVREKRAGLVRNKNAFVVGTVVIRKLDFGGESANDRESHAFDRYLLVNRVPEPKSSCETVQPITTTLRW